MTTSRFSVGGVRHAPRRTLSSAEDLLKEEEEEMPHRLAHERRAQSISIPAASVERRMHAHGQPIEKIPKIFAKSETNMSSFPLNSKPARIYANSTKSKEFHTLFPSLSSDLLYTGEECRAILTVRLNA